MAYQSGKTYYLIPTCEVLSTNDVNNILNKKKQPYALNTKGTGGHYNNFPLHIRAVIQCPQIAVSVVVVTARVFYIKSMGLFLFV